LVSHCMSDHLLGQALPSAIVPRELTNISSVVTHEIHHIHLIAVAITQVDKQLLPCG
jgi:hypothetical protein